MIPAACRFLVSLPTPLAPVSAFVALEHQADLEPVYEAQMAREVERILDAIPAADLAIQWDARYEFAMLDGAIAVWFGDVRAGILERLLRLGALVPPEVELGYHLCYGDEEHGHFSEPQDSKDLVAVANALGDGLERPLTWIHMPVPERRDDDGWFAPMRELRLAPETELYLGLLHPSDRDEGALRRIAAARRHVARFGVATECGWGRGSAEAVMGLLELHRGVSAPLAEPRRALGGGRHAVGLLARALELLALVGARLRPHLAAREREPQDRALHHPELLAAAARCCRAARSARRSRARAGRSRRSGCSACPGRGGARPGSRGCR